MATTVCMTIFVFRGEPDMHYKRHTLVYFTSPDDPDFHESVHAQRDDELSPWRVTVDHEKRTWDMSVTYISHVNAGAMVVSSDEKMLPVHIMAATRVTDREDEGGWNCQHFVLEGLKALVQTGLQTAEWYNVVEDELMERILDGTAG